MNTNDIIELERRYWQAMKDGDAQTARNLSAESCLITSAQGSSTLSADQLAAMIPSAQYELKDFRIADGAKVHFVGDDVAISAYQVHEDLIVDGEPVGIDCALSSTWVKRDGQWKCAAHVESLLGDSFGRDIAHPQSVEGP